MIFAVEGCAHGALETIYATIQRMEERDGYRVDVLLCCGDFQSTRNLEDLQTMAVSNKYRNMCSFYKYYSGELVAPMLTIFIGGNHEASNYLQELPYGGWVAPNIYYLGYAGVIQINGIRIGGMSGIYKGHDYLRGRHEYPPYSESTCRSVYHVRQLEVFRLKQLSGEIHVMMSHDWPRGVYHYGNTEQLLRFKPHFREDVAQDRLGSRPAEDLMRMLKPHYWFSAHLHCKYEAIIPHPPNQTEGADVVAHAYEEPCTQFLALDKCLPRRRFLQICEFGEMKDRPDAVVPMRLEYDLEWLTILNLTNHLMTTKGSNYYLPGPNGTGERYQFTPTREEMENVKKLFNNDLRIPDNFCRTADPYDPRVPITRYVEIQQPQPRLNPQTLAFCETLRIDDPVQVLLANKDVIGGGGAANFSNFMYSPKDANLSTLNESNISAGLDTSSKTNVKSALKLPAPLAAGANNEFDSSKNNPDEIDLDDDDDNDKEDAGKSSIESLSELDNSKADTSTGQKPSRNEETGQADEQTKDEAGNNSLESLSELDNSNADSSTGQKHAAGLEQDTTATPIKKFKRRNETIYTDEPETLEE